MQPASDLSSPSKNASADNYDRLFVRAHARLASRFPLQPTTEEIEDFTNDIAQIALTVGKLRHLLRNNDLLAPYLCLGGFYLAQGDYDEAEQWYTSGRAYLEKQLTASHADTVRLTNSLAILFRTKGNYDEAERLWLRLIEIKRQTPGDTTADIITLMNNVIPLYIERKRLEDAEGLIDESLKLFNQIDYKQAMTVELPVYNNLASYFQYIGDTKSAEEYHLITLDIIKTTLGEKHPRMVRKNCNIGIFFHENAAYDKASDAYEEALELALEIFGERHLETAMVFSQIASLHADTGNPDSAELCFLKALDILQDLFEGNHPLSADILWDLGTLYNSASMVEDAEDTYIRALQAHKSLLGETHPKVIWKMSELAVFHLEQGDSDLALRLALEAESTLKNIHGKTELYPKIIQDVATIYQRQGLVGLAMRYFDEALELYRYFYGEQHLKVARCLWAIGLTYDEHGVNKKAEEFYLDGFSMASNVLGNTHPDSSQFRLDLGKFYLKTNRNDEAKSHIEKALSGFLSAFGDSDYRVADCRKTLEQIR